MVTQQNISALEKSINDILMETQDKTVDICCNCLESLLDDNQGFTVVQIMFEARKFNKRMWIFKSGERFYTPPDFLLSRIHSREPYHKLADLMNSNPSNWFEYVYLFETNQLHSVPG